MGPKTIEELSEMAEELKEQLWEYMDASHIDSPQLRNAMNLTLDEIDVLKAPLEAS